VRGLIEGQAASTPIESVLPAMLADDPFAQRLCAALDEVLAPMTSALDNLDAYLDPRTAPPDFLRWLAGWVGVDAAASLDESTLRRRVLQAPRTHSLRGTAGAFATDVAGALGLPIECVTVEDTGGVSWSRVPGGTAPGRARDDQGDLVVRVRSDLPSSAVRAAVAAAAPAHLSVRVLMEQP
jgi:phage tail-like protein